MKTINVALSTDGKRYRFVYERNRYYVEAENFNMWREKMAGLGYKIETVQ